MFTDLSIVIVNWNLKEDTIHCIDSLLIAGVLPNQIIVVDNGSTDGSMTAFTQKYQNELNVIDAKENLGFAGGNNLGIAYSLRQNIRWILLLNNDTSVAVDFLDKMHHAIQTAQGFSILSPVIFYFDEPEKVWYLGDRQIGNTLLTTSYYKNSKIDRDLPMVLPIDFANGAAMMIDRAVFEKIGLFNASLFMYAEEVDFCWRARLAGFKFACVTSAKIWHKVSKSSQGDHPRAFYLRTRNQIFFYRRYSKKVHLSFLFLFTLLRVLMISLSDVVRLKLDLIPARFRGWLDGWFLKLPIKTVNYGNSSV